MKLEDCLEDYFNARVDVLRDSEEAKKSIMDDGKPDRHPRLIHHDTARPTSADDEAAPPMTASPTEISPSTLGFEDPRPGIDAPLLNEAAHAGCFTRQNGFPRDSEHGEASSSQRRPPSRERSAGVIRRVLVDEQGRPTGDVPGLQRARRKGSSVVKAVAIPAWQFFRLIRECMVRGCSRLSSDLCSSLARAHKHRAPERHRGGHEF